VARVKRETLLIALTVPAALAASGVSALIYLVYDLGMNSSADIGLADLPLLFVYLVLVAFTGFFIALPSLLLVGLPLTWPLRRRIAAHPLIAAILYGAVGAGAARLIMTWLDRGSAFPGRDDVPATLFGAVTAIAWVWTLWKARALLDEPR
jgi:hypothetical protein